MRKSAKARLIIALITAVILTTILVLGIVIPKKIDFSNKSIQILPGSYNAIQPFPGDYNTSCTYPNAEEYKTGSAEIPADGISSLDITWHAGEVSIVPFDGDTIKLEEDAADNPDYALRYRNDGGRLTIKPCKSMNIRQKGPIRELDKTLTVYLPKALSEKLKSIDCETISAGLRINGLTAGSLKSETVSGILSSENCIFNGITADSVSGTIALTEVSVKNADLGTVSGSIKLNGTAEKIDAETVSAAISLELRNMPESLKTGSVSGQTTVNLPENNGFELSLDKVSGKLKNDFPMTADGNRHIYKNGGPHYDCETISGNVYFKKHFKL